MAGNVIARAMLDAVVDAVPQWYRCPYGLHYRPLSFKGEDGGFRSHRPVPDKLGKLLQFAEGKVDTWYTALEKLESGSIVELLQENLAVYWLTLLGKEVDWRRLLRYAQEASARTLENDQVTFNLTIAKGTGGRSVTESGAAKILDMLVGAPQVALRVDRSLRFMSYDEWAARGTELERPMCGPGFLHPYVSNLESGEFSVHLTNKGDLVIANRDGLAASRRKGRWHLYDLPAFKGAVWEVLKSTHQVTTKSARQQLVDWLTQAAFDLSYRRHGALLVYDPEHRVARNHVQNATALLGSAGDWADIVGTKLRNIARESAASQFSMRRRFVQLASVDGAVLFDDSGILGFGAIIKSPDDTRNSQGDDRRPQMGARTAAAQNVYRYGSLPIKVSADGDIKIYFTSTERSGSADASFEFM